MGSSWLFILGTCPRITNFYHQLKIGRGLVLLCYICFLSCSNQHTHMTNQEMECCSAIRNHLQIWLSFGFDICVISNHLDPNISNMNACQGFVGSRHSWLKTALRKREASCTHQRIVLLWYMSYHVLWGTHGTLVPAVDFIVHRPFLSFARSLKKKFQPKLFEGDWFHVFPCSNSSTSYTKCGSLVHHPQGIPWIPKGSRQPLDVESSPSRHRPRTRGSPSGRISCPGNAGVL
jgi:hypothetical protein